MKKKINGAQTSINTTVYYKHPFFPFFAFYSPKKKSWFIINMVLNAPLTHTLNSGAKANDTIISNLTSLSTDVASVLGQVDDVKNDTNNLVVKSNTPGNLVDSVKAMIELHDTAPVNSPYNGRYDSYWTADNPLYPQGGIDGKIVFYGSSTFRFWNTAATMSQIDPETYSFTNGSIYGQLDAKADDALAQSFLNRNVINYGYGGATWADAWEYVGQLLPPTSIPSAVCTFFGTNDIYNIQNPATTEAYAANIRGFLEYMAANHPTVPVIMLGITHTIARANLSNCNHEFNKFMKTLASLNPNFYYLSTHHSLGSTNSEVKKYLNFPDYGYFTFTYSPELTQYIAGGDGLHLNSAGYAVLAQQFEALFTSLGLPTITPP
jgi:lysophospholipase L1-like esterase